MNDWNEVFTKHSEVTEVKPAPNEIASRAGAIDWQEMLRNASPGPEKWRVLSAKEAYDQERQHQKHSEAMQEKQKEIGAVLALRPADRNKEYYDKMQREQGSLYYRPEIQKQKAQDRRDMGLIWHLKRTPIKMS